MPTPNIRTASSSDETSVLDVMTLAFSTDPIMRWLFPQPHKYLEGFPRLTRAYGGKSFAHQSAFVAEQYAGAAMWLPPTVHFDEQAMGEMAVELIPQNIQADAFGLLSEMPKFHPKEPHWFLAVIGVDPARQNQGQGSALMEHALRACDREHLPAYLESSNPRNLTLYRKHGFEVIATLQKGSSPPMFPMIRPAR